MQITGTVIEIFPLIEKTRISRKDFGVEFESEGRKKQAKFTCKGALTELVNFEIGSKVSVTFELDPWRNETEKNVYYNHELRITNLEVLQKSD